MNLLAIDTAYGRCSVALLAEGNIAAFKIFETPSKQAEILLTLIEDVLKQKHLGYADLSHVAVCVGPGSFTGLRIGIAAAQGISFSKNIPLIGISSLEALAQQFDAASDFAVALNAQRGQAYVQCFKASKEAADAAALLETTDVAATIKAKGIRTLTGNCEGIIGSAGENLFYDARNIAQVAQQKIQKNDLPAAVPFYIRPPDAKLPKKSA